MFQISFSFFLLALIAIQFVVARAPLESGTYVIQDINGKYLGIGSVPSKGPLPDLPIRLFEETSRFVEMWEVEVEKNGAISLSLGRGRADDYKVIAKGDFAIVSTSKAATAWSTQYLGDSAKHVMIGSPHSDLVFTSDEYGFQIALRADLGLPEQQFRFIRIDRSNEDVGGQYHYNGMDRDLYLYDRFNRLESWLGNSRCVRY